jgi:hypothetical protein
MGCSGCGNNGPTPIVGNLDDGAVVLAYTGERTAAVTYTANGQQYQAGRDRIHDFVRVRPGDVNVLLNTGHFERAADWTPTLGVIIPTRGRPVELARCLDSLAATAPGVGIVVVVDEDDAETMAVVERYMGRLPIHVERSLSGATAAEKWNIGAASTAANTLVFAADDLVFHEGWAEKATKALKAFPDGSALVGFDEMAGSPHPLHYAVTRKLLDEINGGLLVAPHYRSWYMDVELCAKARQWARYIANCGAIVEHRHPQHGTAPIDDTHRRGFLANQHRDRYVFQMRERASFPVDWAKGQTPRNWLAGFVPPAQDRTEQILASRVGVKVEAAKPAKKVARRKAVAA